MTFYKPYTKYSKTRKKADKRVLQNITKEDRGFTSECWIWGGEKDRSGYGRIKRNGRYVMVHWVLKGDPPAGLEVDHLCNQRDCVNPDHLEYVTTKENAIRREQRKK